MLTHACYRCQKLFQARRQCIPCLCYRYGHGIHSLDNQHTPHAIPDYTSSSTWHADRTRCFIVSYMFPKRAVYCPILSSIDETRGSCGQSRLVQLWLRRQTKQVTRTARVVMLASANNAAVYYIGVVRRTGPSAPTCKNVTRSLSFQGRFNCFNFICNQQSNYILLTKLIGQSINVQST